MQNVVTFRWVEGHEFLFFRSGYVSISVVTQKALDLKNQPGEKQSMIATQWEIGRHIFELKALLPKMNGQALSGHLEIDLSPSRPFSSCLRVVHTQWSDASPLTV